MKRTLALLIALCLLLPALAEAEAEDITARCTFRVDVRRKSIVNLTDGLYKTLWESGSVSRGYLEIETPADAPCYALYVSFEKAPVRYALEKYENDEWVYVSDGEAAYLNDVIEVPGLTRFRVKCGQGNRERLSVCEIRVFSQGELPSFVQRWEPPQGKADLLVLAAHPDDELLWFGGAIPYYAARGKRVKVVYMTDTGYMRDHELLDGLWRCGLTWYPEIGPFRDHYSLSPKELTKYWGGKRVEAFMVFLYRFYRPEVVVTHDLKGEYGHAAHRVAAEAAARYVSLAADGGYITDLPAWQVRKVYLHLYKENQIRMDWSAPIPSLGGESALEAARAAFACHLSQVRRGYYEVSEGGDMDNGLFGLACTAVGADEAGGDFFEHIGE